ncbi:hypothetical protein COU37_05380 [Candidatus Micrarchaeota archaeon CG10_big_fil_rev_8_21_14_0_10_45_29]|nr:MAG: hypothetical protein COU37_05380 [Candidatus Micrarchaeota archaeon CG10_big_fil_rev_8_21_14_0_10_45_29]
MEQILAPALIVLFFSGFFVVFGIGGASVFVPIFATLGIGIKEAIIAGLFINIVSTGVATIIFAKGGLFKFRDLKDALSILLGMLFAIPAGVFISNMLSSQILVGLFSLSLFACSFFMLKEGEKAKDAQGGASKVQNINAGKFSSTLVLALVGIIAGLANGILGIGGGVFIVPALIMNGMFARRAAIISVACTFFGSIFSLSNHLAYGKANFPLLGAVGAAALIGALAGSHLFSSGKVSSPMITRAFPFLLILLAIKLALDFFAGV